MHRTLAVSHAKKRSEVQAKAVGVSSGTLFGAGMRRETHFPRGPTTLVSPRLLFPGRRGLGQEPLIPDLLEVMIVGKRLSHPTVSHHDKRRAVRETEGFVSVS